MDVVRRVVEATPVEDAAHRKLMACMADAVRRVRAVTAVSAGHRARVHAKAVIATIAACAADALKRNNSLKHNYFVIPSLPSEGITAYLHNFLANYPYSRHTPAQNPKPKNVKIRLHVALRIRHLKNIIIK